MSNFLEKNLQVEQSDVPYLQSKEDQEQDPLLELDSVDPSSYRPHLYEEDVLYYGLIVKNGEPVESIEPIDVSLNNVPMAPEQVLDNALFDCACACEDYSLYDYEIMDEAMVAISNYDAGPRDDYGDDMYD